MNALQNLWVRADPALRKDLESQLDRYFEWQYLKVCIVLSMTLVFTIVLYSMPSARNVASVFTLLAIGIVIVFLSFRFFAPNLTLMSEFLADCQDLSKLTRMPPEDLNDIHIPKLLQDLHDYPHPSFDYAALRRVADRFGIEVNHN